MMKRTISGMIGAGSLAHNRRDFVAENVDPKKRNIISVTEMKTYRKFTKSCLMRPWRDTMLENEMIERLPIIMKRYGWGNRRSFFMR